MPKCRTAVIVIIVCILYIATLTIQLFMVEESLWPSPLPTKPMSPHSLRPFENATGSSSVILQGNEDESEVKRPWSRLKVGIYMTTHLSKQHIEFLQKCWPTAIEKFPLLRDAHLILDTSANTTGDF